METVSVTRTFDASPESIRGLVTDVRPFIEACGFDDVSVTGSAVHIENSVGLLTIELDLELVDEPGAVLAYEQREGIFDTMTTRYELDAGASTTLTATTDFALDVALVGEILDSTVIERQRQKELAAQFGYLADAVADS
ncbi:hypothetical protein SAMN05216226_107134 [Halovenus aranensis]|jgi:hypothetical protein|uniref:Polyketide cyclase / dehydrase and lipid transport n=1 Tax=Halovenus aranensis TaxID=890420 RepID=A0A1G8VSY0_9EURY|nr:hypothetical protein [Halovenus aranensis]SDJ68993.1 hypothetical protein SAMN05216226_107134 [Halovenus aranensis]